MNSLNRRRFANYMGYLLKNNISFTVICELLIFTPRRSREDKYSRRELIPLEGLVLVQIRPTSRCPEGPFTAYKRSVAAVSSGRRLILAPPPPAAMIHLRRSFLSRLLHPPCPTPANPLPLHRLLSSAAAAAPIPPEPFAVEDYLVDSCGLTRARAKKASGKLSHLRSPSNPDAVLAFLSGLGLSRPDIAAVVVNDPLFICARVDKTLATRVAELTDLGLSRSQIARLIPVVRSLFRCKSLAPRLAFLLTVFGSFDRCLEVIKTNYGVLSSNVEAVIKPNLAVLKECGISIADRPSYAFASRVISRPTKHLEEAVVLANEFGAKQGTRVFTNAVMIFGILGQEKLAKKLEFFKKLGWSQDDLSLAVRSMPHILAMKEERMRRGMKFLTEDVGLEIPYIARRPALTMYSIERRLLPRHCLINVLKGNGLLKADYDFYNISVISNDDFMEKFVQPYVESVPGLGDAYASSCTGCGVHQLKLLSKRKTKC
jgi:mTERF domain-containing protein